MGWGGKRKRKGRNGREGKGREGKGRESSNRVVQNMRLCGLGMSGCGQTEEGSKGGCLTACTCVVVVELFVEGDSAIGTVDIAMC